MKIIFGLYSELSFAPSSLFEKTLSLTYEPVLSFLYNNPGYRITLYHTSYFGEYIQTHHSEYRALISSLVKRGEVEMLSSSFSLTPLSLLHPKDRVSDIERMTSFIRHGYSSLPSNFFLYNGVWQNGYITSLKSAGMEGVVINCISKDEEFVMKELGKKINVYPIDGVISSRLDEYSKGLISKEEFEDATFERIKCREKEGKSTIIFLNTDKLIARGEDFSSFLTKLIVKSNGLKMEEVKPSHLDYLPSSWYGNDSEIRKEEHYNYTFLKNDNFRYLYNRYLSLVDSSQNRGNRFLKKEVNECLSLVPLGSAFTFSSDYSPLQRETRRRVWEGIILSEKSFLSYGFSPSIKEIDLEDRGENNTVFSNKNYLVVFSPFGASVTEFDSFSFLRNLFDSFPSLSSDTSPLNKSFIDEIITQNKTYKCNDKLFLSEIVDNKRSEISFILDEDEDPFMLSKRYKLRQSTFLLDSTVVSKKKEIVGEYKVSLFLPNTFTFSSTAENEMKMKVKEGVEEKTIKYIDGDIILVFSSIKNFSLTEEEEKYSVNTPLIKEEFSLWKKVSFSFPLALKKEEGVTFRLAVKVMNNKKE